MRRLDSEVAIILVPSVVMSMTPLVPSLPNHEDFSDWALSHETLRGLWVDCDRTDWMKWVADEAASWGVIKPVQVPEDVSAAAVRSHLGNPFDALNQDAIKKRRQKISCWVDDDGQLRVTFNEWIH